MYIIENYLKNPNVSRSNRKIIQVCIGLVQRKNWGRKFKNPEPFMMDFWPKRIWIIHSPFYFVNKINPLRHKHLKYMYIWIKFEKACWYRQIKYWMMLRWWYQHWPNIWTFLIDFKNTHGTIYVLLPSK